MSNIKKRLEDAWLNIPGELQDSKIFNPLETIPPFFEESPHLYILSLLQKPEYLCFAAREILNVKLLPIQAMMMREMWTHKFPMLIASRGFGKCEKNSYVETESGFVKIDDLVGNIPTMTRLYTNNLKLRGINGYQPVEYVWKNNKEELVCIETEAGFKKICTKNHPIMTVQNDKIDWQDAGTIVEGAYIPIVRDDNWFPTHNNINEDLAYLFGVLVGDGSYTVRGKITITTEDSEIINRCNEIALKYFGKIFKRQKRKISYLLCSTSIWDRLFSEFGFNSFVCAEKSFPKTILHAKKSTVAAFISGLFDTDGYTSKDKKWLEYCSKSEDLVKTLQFVLTKFGIISRVKSRLNKKYNRRYYYLYIFGDNVNIFYDKINFKLTKKVNKLNIDRYGIRGIPSESKLNLVLYVIIKY
jgi:intein/homing endonuclease